MADLVIDTYSAQDWQQLAGAYSGFNLMQCHAYGEAKAAEGGWSVERGRIVKDGETLGVFQALVRTLPLGLGGLVWINRGPLWRHPDKDENHQILEKILKALKYHYVMKKGMYLRIAPADHLETGFEQIAQNADFTPAGTAGWSSAKLDLSPPVEDLRKNLAQKWRNCLNKAERQGFQVRQGTDNEAFSQFLKIHSEFLDSTGFETTVTPDLLQNLQDRFGDHEKMTSLIAMEEDQPIASVLIARYGSTCEYLAGNNTERGRNVNAGQLLLWQALEHMKQQGCRWFDVGGLDKQLTPEGIYRFKAGLSGTPYQLASEVEGVIGLFSRLVRWRVRHAKSEGQG